MNIKEVSKVLPYTKEEIEQVVAEVFSAYKSDNVLSDIPEWLLPQLDKELKRFIKINLHCVN